MLKNKEGKLIVIEGACDGIGKTTQYELLCKRLEEKGLKVSKHHFPTYNTFQGEGDTRYLKGEFGKPNELSPYFINSLYAIDRAVTWKLELKKKYESGDIILLDRFTTSSLIYQSALIENIEEKKKFIDFVADYEYNKLDMRKPDCVIFLTAPFDVVTKIRQERKSNDGVKNDIHERDLVYMKKVYDNAMFVADYLSWNKIICNNENQMKSIEEIHNEIMESLKSIL